MTQIVYLIENIAPGLYLFCAAGLLFWLFRLLRANRRLALAEFELEREMAEQRRATATTWSLGMVEVALAVFAVAAVIAPTLRQDLLTGGDNSASSANAGPTKPFETSTPGGDGSQAESVFLTVTAQSQAGGGSVLQLTPVASPTPVGTIIPGYPTPVGCNTDQADLTVPAAGMIVFDTLVAVGKADIPNFASYKLELRGPSTGNEYAPIVDRTSPVKEEGALGQFPVSSFQTGDYTFRLAVFDNTGALRASCAVVIYIQPRPPTPTPPGGS